VGIPSEKGNPREGTTIAILPLNNVWSRNFRLIWRCDWVVAFKFQLLKTNDDE